MMVRAWVIWVILGCALVTVIPRVAPLVFLSRVRMPRVLEQWLGYVPVAVLAALFAQSVAMPAGRLDLTFGNHALLAAAPVLLVALLTRSLIGTVVSGVALMAVLRLLTAS